MIIKTKLICFLFFLYIFKNLYSYEIIRDPIFEDYFIDLSKELKLNKIDVYLVKNKSANAFVIEDKIYFTTGLFEEINEEDTLKLIFLHEYGHIIKNHFQAKKIKTLQANNKSAFYNLFSIGLGVIAGNANISIGTSITLNTSIINDISNHSVNYEIEADNFMINQIEKNKIHTLELISFLKKIDVTHENYFSTHPRSQERINNLNKFNFKKLENSQKFEWIKAKYSHKSRVKKFNVFFINLKKGIFNKDEKLNGIDKQLIKYEAYKRGFLIKDWEDEFHNLSTINSNSFLKIEYINYLLDNNLESKYYIIENLKFNKKLKDEYFYYFIYGKYYNKISNKNLSNFYFCQFYKYINSKNKADFFCKKYDIKDIPILDKSYALFK